MPTTIRQDEFFDAIARGDMAMVNEVLRDRPGAVEWGMEVSAGMKLAGGGLRMPLHHAVLFKQDEVVRALIDAGAELDPKDKSLDTPLMIATQISQVPIAFMLLDAGAGVDVRCSLEDTPLMMAARAKGYAIAYKLITMGADINAQSDNGSTPLHCAAGSGDTKMIALLIRHGADETIKNDTGQTPADRDKNLAAYIDGCVARRNERRAFVENQVDMVKNGSHAPVTVRKPLKLKANPLSP